MKNCCNNDNKPSTARKIYNRTIYVVILFLSVGILISILFK